jgi:hypothetical protein
MKFSVNPCKNIFDLYIYINNFRKIFCICLTYFQITGTDGTGYPSLTLRTGRTGTYLFKFRDGTDGRVVLKIGTGRTRPKKKWDFGDTVGWYCLELYRRLSTIAFFFSDSFLNFVRALFIAPVLCHSPPYF